MGAVVCCHCACRVTGQVPGVDFLRVSLGVEQVGDEQILSSYKVDMRLYKDRRYG